MEREAEDPAGDLHALSWSKRWAPGVLCCVGHMFVGESGESMSEGDLVVAKKLVAFPLNLWSG